MGLSGVLNRPIATAATAALLLSGFLLLSSLLLRRNQPLLRTLPALRPPQPSDDLLATLVHYATSPLLPQQSRAEISVTYAILRRRSPCNFLVFGLGHDSPMWSALNPGGRTLFLEEDPKWLQSMRRQFPALAAHHVRYPTKLSEADDMLRNYRSWPGCLRGSWRCRLALGGLPAEVYGTEWDVVMIDAPRGYFAEAPGRMGAIYSAAVMGRTRRGEGATDVLLHDVERPVERRFGMEFLCKKFLVGGVGRLWHFRIPPARGNGTEVEGRFC